MQSFPVISSIVSTSHLCAFLQVNYNLSAKANCRLLKTGINHSYLVSDGTDKYVLRLYSFNWRSEAEINEEIRLLNLLKADGIPVSYPLPDANGNYIQQINAPEGLRFGLMFSFAEGEKMLNFSIDTHYKVGQTMARIHRVTQNLQMQRVDYTPEVVLHEPLRYLDKFLAKDTDEMAWMLSVQKYLLNEIINADEGQMRKGVVHLDIWFDNMAITPDGAVTIFDFDFCGNGWLAYDIAYYILQLHSTEKDVAEREQKKASFFDGYQSITPISAEEMRMLPVLGVSLYFFYLGIQSRRFNDWSNVFFNDVYLKRFINLLVKKYFEENVTAQLLPL